MLFTELQNIVKSFKNYFGPQCQHVSFLTKNEFATPAQQGEHELLTLLLLAQCDMVIASGSYQSVAAKMINPTLQLKEIDTFFFALK